MNLRTPHPPFGHLLPQGEKGINFYPSPLVGKGGALAPDER